MSARPSSVTSPIAIAPAPITPGLPAPYDQLGGPSVPSDPWRWTHTASPFVDVLSVRATRSARPSPLTSPIATESVLIAAGTGAAGSTRQLTLRSCRAAGPLDECRSADDTST